MAVNPIQSAVMMDQCSDFVYSNQAICKIQPSKAILSMYPVDVIPVIYAANMMKSRTHRKIVFQDQRYRYRMLFVVRGMQSCCGDLLEVANKWPQSPSNLPLSSKGVHTAPLGELCFKKLDPRPL